MENANKQYLETRLDELKKTGVLDNFEIKTSEGGEYLVTFEAGGANFLIVADFKSYMEIKINDYFHEVTDYLKGDYRQTIDWYLDITQKVASGQYELESYSRSGEVIARYLIIRSTKGTIRIGDRQNHFKLFAKKSIARPQT